MVPNGWKSVYLNDISEKIMVGIASAATHAYCDDGIRMLRNLNIKDGWIDDSDILFVNEEYEKQHKNKRLKTGDILTVRTGYPGVSAVVPEKYNNAQCFTSLITRLNTSNALPAYICRFINSEYGKKYITSGEAGGAQKNVNAAILKKMRIPLPPLLEQQKIGNILSTWDKAISTTERLIDNSTQQKKALMQVLLTGKKRLIDESGKPFEGEWEVLTIGDVVELFNGYAFKSSDALEKGYKWLKIANVGIGEIKWDSSSYLPEGYEDEYNRFNLKVGDVVVAMTRPTLGNQLKIARLKNKADESLLNQRVAKLLFSEKVSSEYMYQLLSTIEVALKLNHALLGTDPPNLSTKVLHEISMELPSLIEQQKIATVLTNADQEIELLKQQLADLQQEKKALMQVLLTGKRRVVVDS